MVRFFDPHNLCISPSHLASRIIQFSFPSHFSFHPTFLFNLLHIPLIATPILLSDGPLFLPNDVFLNFCYISFPFSIGSSAFVVIKLLYVSHSHLGRSNFNPHSIVYSLPFPLHLLHIPFIAAPILLSDGPLFWRNVHSHSSIGWSAVVVIKFLYVSPSHLVGWSTFWPNESIWLLHSPHPFSCRTVRFFVPSTILLFSESPDDNSADNMLVGRSDVGRPIKYRRI